MQIGCVMAQEVIRRLLATETRVRFQISECRMCDGPGSTVARFRPGLSVFPCQYTSTEVLYSLTYHLAGRHWVHQRPQFHTDIPQLNPIITIIIVYKYNKYV
jgi:hypothetical protein